MDINIGTGSYGISPRNYCVSSITGATTPKAKQIRKAIKALGKYREERPKIMLLTWKINW